MCSKIRFLSSDDAILMADREVAVMSGYVKDILDGVGEVNGDTSIPRVSIPSLKEAVFKKVLEWCKHHEGDTPTLEEHFSKSDPRFPQVNEDKVFEISFPAHPTSEQSAVVSDWDARFMDVDHQMLFDIIYAASLLDIKPLVDLGCKSVANIMKGKSPEEIRKTFNARDGSTPHDVEQINTKNEHVEEQELAIHCATSSD